MSLLRKAVTTLLACIGLCAIAVAQSAAFQTQEVKFTGHDVSLAGTLLAPKLDAGKRAPAILLVGDSTAQRDGFTFGQVKQNIYRELAEKFVAQGFIVLRYDKRCTGASECKPAASFDDYIDDARGGVEFLKKHPQIDAARLFLFGHGEGGYVVASIGAFDDVKFAGVVLAAAPGRTLNKVMRDEFRVRLTEAGKSDKDIATYLEKCDRVTRGLMGGRTNFPEEKLDPKDPYDAALLALTQRHEAVVALLINDPLQIVNNIKAPVLIVQGRKDLQITVRDAEYLEEALKRANHASHSLQLFDDMDHLLKNNKGKASLGSYTDTARPLDPAMLSAVMTWMQKQNM